MKTANDIIQRLNEIARDYELQRRDCLDENDFDGAIDKGLKRDAIMSAVDEIIAEMKP